MRKAGIAIPKIAPKGTLKAMIVVAFAISDFANQTIASFEGTEIMNPYPNPPIPYVMIYIIREGKNTQSQKEVKSKVAAINPVAWIPFASIT